MISPQEADKILLRQFVRPHIQYLPLAHAYGHILSSPLIANQSSPPADMSQMDGFAVRFNLWKNGQRLFLIKGEQRIGSPPISITDKNSAIPIWTGAIVPKPFDCIIPLEDVGNDGSQITIPANLILKRWQYIRKQASEYKKGQILLKPGTTILGPQFSLLAALGIRRVRIRRKLRIAVIGTGNELVPVANRPKIYQARRSNAAAIAAVLQNRFSPDVKTNHIRDNLSQVTKEISKLTRKIDILIFSGGISKGKYDFIPPALKANGFKILVHGVKQRPGKPFLFAKKGECYAFGLPGNPVSSLLCLYRYVIPFMRKAAGIRHEKQMLTCTGIPSYPDDMTHYCPVKLSSSGGKILSFHSSADLCSWANSDGFIEIPPLKNKGSLAHKVTKESPKLSFYPW